MLQSATGMMLDATWLQELTANLNQIHYNGFAGVCSTDLEIIKGYVPGFDGALGHEFVGVVEECAADPDLVGAASAAGCSM
jgi:D-arabinose 1-dehydrogenase-like Zn-dependent alcohol dehydrogenase